MSESRQEEVERKFAVDPDTDLPDLGGVDAVAGTRASSAGELVAVYFDTRELDLLRHGVTVRRRVGGTDEGWHLKEPSGPEARIETRLPLGRAVHTVPKPLRDRVEEIIGNRRMHPVARVCTHRSEVLLLDAEGDALAVLSDDDVRAERLLEPTLSQHWREWEVELIDGPRALLDGVEPVLLGAGARPAGVSSKLARALAAESPAAGPAPWRAGLRPRRSSARDVLAAYLAEHLRVLREHDAGLRGETVHKLRIAARRMRSALTSYLPLFEPGAVDALCEELRWLGLALGEARDAEVLRAHLDAMTADEPDGPATDALRERIRRDLEESHRIGHEASVEAVGSERYQQLLRSVEAVIESPALRRGASKPARKVLPDLLERDARRLRRAASAAQRADPGTAHQQGLHEVRKKAKRLRYAAESAAPVLGKRARRLSRRAKALQDALGAHQDTVTSRAWLEGLAGRTPGQVAFGAGRLHRREEERARASEADFERAWRRLPRKHDDLWVRGSG